MLDRIMQNIITVTNIPTTNKPPVLKNNNGYSRESTKEYLPEFLIKNNGRTSMEAREKTSMALQVAIWETESTQEMFDFEANKNVKIRDYRIQGSNDVYMMQPQTKNARCVIVKSGVYNDNLYCGKVQNIRGLWSFTPGGQIDSYKVVDPQGSNLTAGGILRIGRMHYFIKQVYDGFSTKFQQFQSLQKGSKKNLKNRLTSLKQGTCKFCLCDETDNPDLLISPCSCKGSCAQVHVQCLKQWLINKVSRKSTSTVEYLNYDNFNCELCRDQLPTTLTVNGKIFNMLNEDSQKTQPYIILQGLPNEKSSTKNNITIKIRFPQGKKAQIIGRGHEAHIRLEDVSISRQHCHIQLKNSQFIVKDNKSKFGTLVRLPASQRVQLMKGVKVQVGRMVMQIVPKKINNQNNIRY